MKIRGIIKNKKGDASSIITFLIIAFFLAIALLVALFGVSKMQEVIDTTVLNSSATAGNASAQIDTITTKTVDRAFAVIVGFLVIGMMVSAFMVRVHPIFLFIYIFVLAIAIFTAVPLANTYEDVMNTEVFSSIASNQTMMNWIMEHLVLVLVGAAALSMIVLFAKLRGGSPFGGTGDF